MRIALITMSAPSDANPYSGQYNLHQARALIDLGASVEIFMPAMWLPALAGRLNAGVRRLLSVPKTWERQGVRCTLVRAPLPHPNFLRERLAPILPRTVGAMARFAFARRLEPLLRAFKPDLLHVHDGVVLGETAATLAAFLRCRFSIIEHEGIDWPAGSRIARCYARTVRAASAVFGVAPPSVDRLIASGVPHARLAPDGIWPATREQLATPRPHEYAGLTLVLSSGSPIPAKGQPELIRAFAEVAPLAPRARLVLVGPLAPACEPLIDELNLRDGIIRLERMPAREFQQWLVWADLFALPSHRESFGMVFAEALAAGTPVLLTDACGIAPLLRQREHGWIVPVRDHAALSGALREALTTADLPAMGLSGRAAIEGRFSWRASAQAILDATAPHDSSAPHAGAA